MKCFKTLAIIFVLAALVFLPTTHSTFERKDAGFIERICKQTPNPSLCVSILKSDPRASTADVTGLALILVDKMKAKAIAATRQISVLYKQKPALRSQLKKCSDNYKAILDGDIPEAEQALALGNPKFAENGIVDAGTEAAICERGFRGGSPLTALTRPMQDLSDIARPIVRMLL